MSTIVYQSVQSYFESQLIETTILELKVAPITSTEDKKCDIQEFNKTFIQNISSTTSSPMEKQGSYVHPFAKTCPRLSQKSLELCTEKLGCETGRNDGTDIDILSLTDVIENSTRQELFSEEEEKKMTPKLESRNSRKGNSSSFPPPLTSIWSSNPIQCRQHREDGRLIIEAIESPSRNTYLQAERSNGRLKLSFLNDCAINFDPEMNDEIDFDEDVIDDYESDVCDEDRYEVGEELHDDDGDDDDEKNDDNMEDKFFVNKIEVDGEIGIEMFQRLSRCMEGSHGNRNLCNWRNSMWVSTS